MDLLPCPHDGSTLLTTVFEDHAFRVSCRGCGAQGPVESTPEEAAAGWNRRAPHPDTTGPTQINDTCAQFVPGTPGDGDCESDGHYRCKHCRTRVAHPEGCHG